MKAALRSTLLLAVFSGLALGAALPNLPKDKALKQGADSPGVVTFRHESHLDTTKPDCTPCHPALFPILKRSAARKPVAFTHEEMLKGRLCGSCHGTSAHGFDDCATCHEAPKDPPPETNKER